LLTGKIDNWFYKIISKWFYKYQSINLAWYFLY
jgi:hypothetical protein